MTEPTKEHHTMSVIDDIAAERRRQIEQEGWTTQHDDCHVDGDLAEAAACYAHHSAQATWLLPKDYSRVGQPMGWPWSHYWWKPKDQRRDLIRAAALIVAEIERLDRAKSHD